MIGSRGSPFNTSFQLNADNSPNKYKVDKLVEKSIDFTNMIPFLRTTDDTITKKLKKNSKSLSN